MTSTRLSLLAERTLTISFIVPVYNEEKNLGEFSKLLSAKAKTLTDSYEILFINDGSRDNSLPLLETLAAQDTHIKLISFSRNFGKEIALTAGLEHCQGNVGLLIDADLQHPFETIDEFLKQWAAGFDMVYGIRDSRASESFIKRHLANLFYRLIDFLSDTKIPHSAGDFRLLDRQVIDAINECQEYDRFMKGLYAWVGFKSTPVIYRVVERKHGRSSFSFPRLWNLALTGIFSFSDIPLRVWSLMGVAISGISLIYALIVVFDTLLFGVDVPGYATIVVAIMFFGGIQLISIGILGEYIARIFREVKQRPKYIIAKKINVS